MFVKVVTAVSFHGTYVLIILKIVVSQTAGAFSRVFSMGHLQYCIFLQGVNSVECLGDPVSFESTVEIFGRMKRLYMYTATGTTAKARKCPKRLSPTETGAVLPGVAVEINGWLEAPSRRGFRLCGYFFRRAECLGDDTPPPTV